MRRHQDSLTGRTSRPGSDVAGKAVRLATKTSAPSGQAGGGRFDDLSCRGSIRTLRPSSKLPPPRSQAPPGNAMPAGSACIPANALPGAGGGASPAVRSQAEPGNEGSDEPTGVGRGGGRPSVWQPRLPLRPDKPAGGGLTIFPAGGSIRSLGPPPNCPYVRTVALA